MSVPSSVSPHPDHDNTSAHISEAVVTEDLVENSVDATEQEATYTEEVPEVEEGTSGGTDDALQDDLPPTSDSEDVRKRYEQLLKDESVAREASGGQAVIERIWNFGVRYWAFGLYCLLGLAAFNYWTQMIENKMRVVDQLEQRRDDMRKRLLFITADLASMQRISNIEQSVQELGLPLEHSLTPPYEIHLPKQEE